MNIIENFKMYVEGYYMDKGQYVSFVIFYELNGDSIKKLRIRLSDNYNYNWIKEYLQQNIIVSEVFEEEIYDNQKRYLYSRYDSDISRVSIIHTQNSLF
ncbi:MAG: hypothetical protein Q8J85_07135 [Sulfuricurvum sp.]|nr:hypothetical protein [Sulfuricurvum sp.]MDP3023000.1 hypothetical protein [Sulfuricurvum sp.]